MLYYHNSYYVETPKGLNALTLDQVGGGVVPSLWTPCNGHPVHITDCPSAFLIEQICSNNGSWVLMFKYCLRSILNCEL